LAKINFESYGGVEWVYWSDEYWEIRPFPEPATLGASFGVIGLGLFAWEKRKRSRPPTQ